jgi:hypothetical protein
MLMIDIQGLHLGEERDTGSEHLESQTRAVSNNRLGSLGIHPAGPGTAARPLLGEQILHCTAAKSKAKILRSLEGNEERVVAHKSLWQPLTASLKTSDRAWTTGVNLMWRT